MRRREALSQLAFIRSSTAQLVNDGNISCPICMDDIHPPFRVLPCGHSYCVVCIDEYCKVASRNGVSPFCPMCHRHFQIENVNEMGNGEA